MQQNIGNFFNGAIGKLHTINVWGNSGSRDSGKTTCQRKGVNIILSVMVLVTIRSSNSLSVVISEKLWGNE